MGTNAELAEQLKVANGRIVELEEAAKAAPSDQSGEIAKLLEDIETLTKENSVLKNAPAKTEVQLTDVVDFKVTNGLFYKKEFYSTKKLNKDVKKEDYLAIKKAHGQKVYLVAREPEM